MKTPIPSALRGVLLEFAPAFTAPSFENFLLLVVGCVLCTGRHSISRIIQFGSDGRLEKNFSAFYRFFSRAVWETDVLSRKLLELAMPLAPHLVFVLDDTLAHKSGSHLWGIGIFHDAMRSTYGRGPSGKRVAAFSPGHNWVTLSLRVPYPWNPRRGIAIPIMWRLYRSKKTCPTTEYRKRTELAVEMLELLSTWLPADRKVTVLADAEYASRTVVRKLPANMKFIGPMDMNAALFALPKPKRRRGRGRPRKKGKRMSSPTQLAADDSIPWKELTAPIYGGNVKLLVKTQRCLWYTVRGVELVSMIVTRDPSGRLENRAFFSTDSDDTPFTIMTTFALRWSQEVQHRDVKQHLGIEDPQNGWWRHPDGHGPAEKLPGPQSHAIRGETAVRHTAPFVFVVYAVVVLWYFRHGDPAADVNRARALAPWNTHKVEPSFGDMLDALRREIWASRVSADPMLRAVAPKIIGLLYGSRRAA